MFAEPAQQKSRHGLLETWAFAIRLLVRSCPALFALVALSVLLQGLAPMVRVLVYKHLCDALVALVASQGDWASFVGVWRMLLVQGLLSAAVILLDRGSEFLTSRMGGYLSVQIRSDILRRVSTFDMCHFDDPDFYDIIARAMRESSERLLSLLRYGGTLATQTITFISLAVLLSRLSTALVVLMIVVSVPVLIVHLKYSRKAYEIQYRRTQHSRLCDYLSRCMIERQYIPEISSLGLWGHLRMRWHQFAQGFFVEDMRLHRARTAAGIGVGVFLILCKAGAGAYIVYLGVARALPMSLGDILMYLEGYSNGTDSLVALLGGGGAVYRESLFFSNLLAFERLEPAGKDRRSTSAAPENIETIELRDVSFAYPGSSQYALRNLNVTFRRGESSLIVGPNGSGKTTLTKLLLRLYEPTQGQILANGRDIRQYDVESLRERMGIIFQDFIRYPFSLAENIAVGHVRHLHDAEKITAAARKGGVAELAESLPLRYDTVLSRQFRDGHELSLGQWQRVCLARLFMRDPPVLIFDEPSASLDMEMEAKLLAEISALSKDKICILVSHRMLREGISDRVIVIEDGMIAEEGSHEHLLHGNGRYAFFWSCMNDATGVK